MVKMKKNAVIKEIPDNLISDYKRLGWVEVKPPKSILSTNEKKDNE